MWLDLSAIYYDSDDNEGMVEEQKAYRGSSYVMMNGGGGSSGSLGPSMVRPRSRTKSMSDDSSFRSKSPWEAKWGDCTESAWVATPVPDPPRINAQGFYGLTEDDEDEDEGEDDDYSDISSPRRQLPPQDPMSAM